MPEVSRFLGIVVALFYNQHGRPHFHAVYGEHKITVDIESLDVHGRFPPRARRLVLEWAVAHRQQLRDCWHRARCGPVLRPLQDPELFRRFEIDPEFHTSTWPNRADMAPEFLHDNVRKTA